MDDITGEEKKTKDVLLRALEYIPLISGLLLLCGCVDLLVYYFVFNLSIFSYTDFGEFLLIGIKEFAKFSFYSLIGFMIPIKAIKYQNENPQLPPEEVRTIKYNNAMKFLNLERYVFLLVSIVYLIGFIISWFLKGEVSKGNFIISSYILVFIILIHYSIKLTEFYIEKNLNTFKRVYLILINYTLIFIVCSMFSSIYDACSVKYDNGNIKNYIEISGKIIQSTENYYFIGETNGYVFFHNSLNNTNDIFPKRIITKISIGN